LKEEGGESRNKVMLFSYKEYKESLKEVKNSKFCFYFCKENPRGRKRYVNKSKIIVNPKSQENPRGRKRKKEIYQQK
jgi:hypothetical protein